MEQFIHGSMAAFQDLEKRAQKVCVRFLHEPMPPGSDPAWALVGFEINPETGAATLFVDKGIRYSGPHQEAREWLASGEKRFENFEQLRRWMQESLSQAYTKSVSAGTSNPAPDLVCPADLTDLGAIQPAETADAGHLLDENSVFEALKSSVRGQDQALKLLAGRTCRHLARRFPRRPATFFAIGPTGVGKTKTAELLPKALRSADPGAVYGYLRLDMNEYMEKHRVSQLLGAPQGYIGYGDGAQLVEALAANPRTVVLFDEIEKAHPDILKVLMNAMDAGRLSTATMTETGRQIDCRWAIFVFTSNLEVKPILDDLEQLGEQADLSAVDNICRNRLRVAGLAPELIGRIGCFLVFKPLSEEAKAEVVTLAVVQVAKEYGIKVRWIEPKVIAYILDETRSERFGARPYEYLIDEVLGNLFAEAVGSFQKGPIKILGGPPFSIVLFNDKVDSRESAPRSSTESLS